jgi:ZIP family zinc transporter
MARRRQNATAITPQQVALGTAVGLGLHNFSEGLAIGQSAATGATTFALLLVIGFALHNTTEGFAISAPLSGTDRPSWRFLTGAGLVGGGPTFAGGVLGYAVVSPVLSILFLGLAAGALIFVFNEMMAVARRFSLPMVTGVALTIGLLAAFGTDFVLSAAGA